LVALKVDEIDISGQGLTWFYNEFRTIDKRKSSMAVVRLQHYTFNNLTFRYL